MQRVDSATEAGRIRAVTRYRILDTPPEEVFDRIARIAARTFRTSMATVSIVDASRIWFKAAVGLRGIGQTTRGRGLCASAILDDVPHVVCDALTDPQASTNPLVRGHLGIRFYAGAPIVTPDGYRLGAVDVFDSRPYQPSDDQLATLIDLAAAVMDHLELRMRRISASRVQQRLRGAEDERDTARADRDVAKRDRDAAEVGRDSAERERDAIEEYAAVLQRTLLPPSLPDIPGLALAAHYHPASRRQVGGDFYDVFAIGPRRWAFFLGDVEGHGAAAAAVTSLIRYTLRSAALHYSDPVEALAELNSVLIRDPSERHSCTVLFGTLEPSVGEPGFQVTVATGGHPPALLLDDADGSVREIRSSGGMLLGALTEATFESCSVRLRPGQTLLFYTDGLIETRNRGVGQFGEDELASFVASRAGLSASELIDDLVALILTLRPSDDIALLVFASR
ncbi:SpoIIE family protein phosphatase [Mycobacterium sp. Aquia_216]|uniref:PP2C family protein-serine/threonine phosphatase n=1 Tax=Mycobacterium sp. Aquia_216 TaxID=2991729 RepID=UPI00227ACC0C|nr:GAF domain-containing SpoIIE family protein phosphatase [Mycobacterium sp. Aquia_216]WAJ43560.1 SpoIIE family protein phosphatase [Mycobacterium sp. Aquia_216]